MVQEAGEALQCDIWKALNLSSREGSRITLRLERKGLVRREPIIHNRRKTYKIVLVRPEAKVSLDDIATCPCFSCPSIERCVPGQPTSPGRCAALTKWLEEEAAVLEETP